MADVYMNELGGSRRGGKFRWLISTCLAAMVGASAIGIVIYGSINDHSGQLRWPWDNVLAAPTPLMASGLKINVARSDRIQNSSAGGTTRLIIHETFQQRLNGRQLIQIKPYARIIARLSTAPPPSPDLVPPLNPVRLYANATPGASKDSQDESASSDVAVKVVELLGGILPSDDGQELDTADVAELVARADAGTREDDIRPGFVAEGAEGLAAEKEARAKLERSRALSESAPPPNTTVLIKTMAEPEDNETGEGQIKHRVAVGRSDTKLLDLLRKNGADASDARTIADVARPYFKDSDLAPGDLLEFGMVPSVLVPGKLEPVRVSIFPGGQNLKVTVYRNVTGDWAASDSLVDPALMSSADAPQRATLYESVYLAALAQHIPQARIEQILRIHAVDTDFKRRTRAGDAVDFFFDINDKDPDSTPGELLYTALSVGSATKGFYRYRSSDGVVDYYDAQGNNTRRFLNRRPVRSEDVRLTSVFGMRRHPLLNTLRPHNGIDWVAAVGTPILAAADGTIEEAARKGEFGNYVRIRHANGYKTQYGHMKAIKAGLQAGMIVRQGDVIGYLGNTGLSTGAHLHFEVLINGRPVDPLKLQVPRERQLSGKQLADFQKERQRIDDLMRLAPVMQYTAAVAGAQVATPTPNIRAATAHK